MARMRFEETGRRSLVLQDRFPFDHELSLRAKGLLGQFYTIKTDFNFTFKNLAETSADSVGAVRSAFRELERLGYLRKKMLRDPSGRFTTMEYTICSRPNKLRAKSEDC